MITPTLCIYHAHCADGFGAAWAVWMRYGHGVEFHAGAHGTPPPDCTGHDVLLVDFSYKLPEMEQVIAQARTVTILDHHKTAQADVQPLLDAGTLQGEFDMERSGAAMAWDWCFPGKPRPRLISHIQDRDLWRFDLTGTRQIGAVIFTYEQDFEVWSGLAEALEEEDAWQALYATGLILERKHLKDVKQLVEVTTRAMVIGGETVPVANLPYMFASEAGNIMAEGQSFAASYYDTPKGRKFSLRSTEAGRDVSEIAVFYGGGGHARAAGFMMPVGWEGEKEGISAESAGGNTDLDSSPK